MSNFLPGSCPSCNNQLFVKTLECTNCGTVVTGKFLLPAILLLNEKEQTFITNFIKCSGSLKQMAKDMKLSYPTVRNILNDIMVKIEEIETKETGVDHE